MSLLSRHDCTTPLSKLLELRSAIVNESRELVANICHGLGGFSLQGALPNNSNFPAGIEKKADTALVAPDVAVYF